MTVTVTVHRTEEEEEERGHRMQLLFLPWSPRRFDSQPERRRT